MVTFSPGPPVVFPLCVHSGGEREKDRAGVSFYKGINPIRSELHPLTSLTLIASLETLSPIQPH